MKNVLVLNGSARKESISTALAASFVDSHSDRYNVKAYNAYKLGAKPCFGCGYCNNHTACINSDLDDFMADFEAADYLVISTPVFNSSVPSPLKAIVDRFQRYYALRFAHGIKPPVPKPKQAALIIAAGSKGEGAAEIEKMFLRQFTVLNTTLEKTIFVDSTDTMPLTKQTREAARLAGNELFN